MKTSPSLAVGIVLFASAIALAQAKPNFSGTWQFDESKSEVPAMGRPGGGGPGGPGGRMGGFSAGSQLVISQTENELIVERKMGDQTTRSVYKLDGSESTNPGMRGGEVKSTSRWDGARLITKSAQSMSSPNGEMTIQSEEVRTLSADGKAMTIETTRSTPRGEMKSKAVFNKVG